MICPICGQDVPAGGHFCPGCGTDLLPYTLEAETGGSFILPEVDLSDASSVLQQEPSPFLSETSMVEPELVTEPESDSREIPPKEKTSGERPWWMNLAIAAAAAVLVIVIEIAVVMHYSAYAQPASVDEPVYTQTIPDLGFRDGETP